MIEIIFLIVLFSSLAGLILIIFQKTPLLLEVNEPLSSEPVWQNFLNKFKEKLPFKKISPEIFFQKTLSKIRVFALKIDNKTSSLLQKLREKTKKKEVEKNDNYWQEVKKFRKKK